MVTAADELVRKGTGAGSDFRGWLDLPSNYDKKNSHGLRRLLKRFAKTPKSLLQSELVAHIWEPVPQLIS